jgi:hypothetical protein
MILRVSLHGCESWSLVKEGELTQRVFDNRVMEKVVGHKTVIANKKVHEAV